MISTGSIQRIPTYSPTLPLVRVEYCEECRVYTNHRLIGGVWICSCAALHDEGADNRVSTQIKEHGV